MFSENKSDTYIAENKSDPFFVFVFAAAAALLLAAGCAGNETENDQCQALPGACPTAGEARCSDDGLAVEECRENADGCLVWTESETCGSGHICDDSGDQPECACSNACTTEGSTQCLGDIVRRCESDADGCLGWVDQQDCGDSGQVCIDSGGAASCAEPCTDLCDFLNQSECSGTVIRRCATGADGCLQWQDFRDCADDGLFCDDTGGEAVCTAQCVTDCDAEGAQRCHGTVIEECVALTADCMQWTPAVDCAATSRVCDDSSGSPLCMGGCEDLCTAEGETACSGEVVQTCRMRSTECLDWVDTTDCAADGKLCDDTTEPAVCVCPPSCTDGATRCRGAWIQTCGLQANGCMDYADTTDCAATGMVCDASSGTAECACPPSCIEGSWRCNGAVRQNCLLTSGGCLAWTDVEDCSLSGLGCDDSVTPPVCASTGESCTDFRLIGPTPYVLSGSDFTADYSDDQALSGTDCRTRTGSAEAVFAIDLAAGESVLVRELGGIDVVVSFQSACGDSESCILSEDYDEVTGFRYTAAGAERLFIIVESYYSAPGTRDYEVHVDRPLPESCGDGNDNDIDGDVDCADPDCFGNPTYCATESLCGDAADNDADSLTDCDDPDCGAAPECQPYRGTWEQFETWDPADINGYLLVFTPDSGDPNLYTWAITGGIGAYGVTPGSGTATSTLTLGDDATAPYALSVMSEVRVFDTPYTSFFVSSNGNLTFAAAHSGYAQDAATFFSYVRIAGFYRDLDPRTTGTITVDETAGRIAVTWDSVPQLGSPTTLNSFQVVIDASGTIEIYFVDVQSTTGMIGISSGTGNVIPEETDFVPEPPPAFAAINEVVYDNNGADTREFIELYAEPGKGLEGYTLVHFDGATGGVVWALDLGGIRIPSDGFVVVGDAGVPNLDAGWAARGITAEDALRGDQESLVLYTEWDGATGTVIDAVGWGAAASFRGEGSPAPEIEFESWDNSIGRYTDGIDTGNNAADFVQSWWDTPGTANTMSQPAGWIRVTGSTQGNDAYPAAVPDNNPAGTTLTITTPAWLPSTISDIHVGIKISHAFIGDLIVTFTSPAGTSVTLHNNTGGSADDILTVFDLVTPPDVGSMTGFDGQSTSPGTGTWTLAVVDNDAGISGTIEEWIIWVI